MIEAGEQRRLLAEIARQRHHLDVERVGRQRAARSRASRRGCRRRHRRPRSARPRVCLEAPRDLGDARVQRGRPAASLKTGTTIERPASARPRGRGAAPVPPGQAHRIGRHSACLSSRLAPPRRIYSAAAAPCRARPACILSHRWPQERGEACGRDVLSGAGHETAPAARELSATASSQPWSARGRHAQGGELRARRAWSIRFVDFGVFSFAYYYLGLPIIAVQRAVLVRSR